MNFNWVGNIRCTISDGNSFITEADRAKMKCPGACWDCKAFLGVDISQIGEKYFQGSCSEMDTRRSGGIGNAARF